MRKFLLVALLGCIFSASGFAVEEQDIGRWWDRSALSYDPILEAWLFHVEATVSYQKLSGNTEGTVYSASPLLTIRKGRFSNYLGYNLSAQDVVYSAGSGAVDTRTESITVDLAYEITEWLFVRGGYRNDKDDLTYIKNRDTYFGGVGSSWTTMQDRLTMGAFLAYGNEDTDYLSELELPAEESDAIYVTPSISYQLTQSVSVGGSATYVEYIDNDLGKRWNTNIGLDVALAPHVYLSLSWTKTYENNIAIRLNPDADNTTTVQVVGLKVSY
jgi:predicted porin